MKDFASSITRPLFLILTASSLVACASLPPTAKASSSSPPSAMQWLYRSGEASISQRATFQNLTAYLEHALDAQPRTSTPSAPSHMAAPNRLGDSGSGPCGSRRPVVVFDIDETVLLNLGYERYLVKTGKNYSAETWSEWELTGANEVAAVPGAVQAMADLHRLGITPVFISDRSSRNRAQTIAALQFAGLGSPMHMDTLFLRGDVSDAPGKDARREFVAQSNCVLALVGDQLGDFSDALVGSNLAAPNDLLSYPWGKGWFVMPNPVYGTGVRGLLDDVIPAKYDWAPPSTPSARRRR